MWVVDSLCFTHSSALTCTPAAIALEVDVALGNEQSGPYYRIHGVLLYAPAPSTPTDATAAELHWRSTTAPHVVTVDRLDDAGRHRGPLAPGAPPS